MVSHAHLTENVEVLLHMELHISSCCLPHGNGPSHSSHLGGTRTRNLEGSFRQRSSTRPVTRRLLCYRQFEVSLPILRLLHSPPLRPPARCLNQNVSLVTEVLT